MRRTAGSQPKKEDSKVIEAGDLLSETSDMHIHSSDIPRILVTPYKIEQILPAVYFIRIIDQKLEL